MAPQANDFVHLTNRRTSLDHEPLDNVICIRTVAKLGSKM